MNLQVLLTLEPQTFSWLIRGFGASIRVEGADTSGLFGGWGARSQDLVQSPRMQISTLKPTRQEMEESGVQAKEQLQILQQGLERPGEGSAM